MSATTVEGDVRVVTRDGIELSTDVYHPDGAGPFPSLLQRTCYGKEVLAGYSGISRFVDAGYRVVFQDCRGSGMSGGALDFFQEADDGRDAGDWISRQPWFDGRLGTFGASYMSFTQWALASTRPPYLKAMVVASHGSERAAAWFPGGSLALDILLPWTITMAAGLDTTMAGEPPSLAAAFAHLPLADAARVAVGRDVPWYRDWLRHADRADPHWKSLDFTDSHDAGVPVLLLDGWYDFAVPHMVGDHRRLRAAGAPTRLVVGPWTHFSADERMADESIRWFDRYLKGDDAVDPGGPVSVFVMPDGGWRELPDWPHDAGAERWCLQPGGRLAPEAPPRSDATAYTYDPADPTPAAGGPSLRMEHCGPVDNRELEARTDVLTFSSEPLTEPFEIVGPVRAELFLQSDVDHFDVYLRLCDVWPDGRSINLCDGIRRLTPTDIERAEDGTFAIEIDMWPTAQRFAVGHRVRLQLSGGAHPLFARNTCSGEPLASARTLVTAHNAVRHDPQHPSAVLLPMASA